MPCSLAIEAINDGVLNEAEKATPKILTSIPKIIKAYPHLPIVVPSPFARAPPNALASGVEYPPNLVPESPTATVIINASKIVTLTITAINTRGIFFSGFFICLAAIGKNEKPVKR